tara:strand:- start:2235 stop:3389 length:1155 start_codon:yes stop_codon:yes gene_type:complete
MSTLKVTNIKHEDTTNGGIQLDSDGHVQVDGIQLPTTGTLSNRNLIINGAMNVAQRNSSGTSNGFTCIDRFGRDVNSGTGTFTDSQQTLSSGAPYDEGFRKFYRTASSSASTAGTTSYLQVRYKAEAQDIACSGWEYTSSSSYITLSFWVRASVAQTYGFSVQSHDGTDYVYNKTFDLSADTWTKVTQSIPGRSGLTFDNNNGIGLIIKWFPHLGSTYNGATDDTWDTVANSNYGASLGTDWWTASSATFDLTGVQLEVGEMATPFEHRKYGDELARCQRYYQELDIGDNNNVLHMNFTRYSHGSGNPFAYSTFPVQMRAAPSFSFLGETYNASGYTGNPTLGAASVNGVQLNGGNSASANATHYLRPNNDSGDFLRLTFSAEL